MSRMMFPLSIAAFVVTALQAGQLSGGVPAGPKADATVAPYALQQSIAAFDGAADDRLGRAAVSGDTAIIGSGYIDIAGERDRGAAYVLARTNRGWAFEQKLLASDGAEDDEFGRSVAIDGDTVVVGAPGDYAGSVYVFRRSGTVWNETQKLTPSDGADGDNFGLSVGIDGDWIVVGAPRVDVSGQTDRGAAYVFHWNGSGWEQSQKLVSSEGRGLEGLGGSVSIDGSYLAIGAPGALFYPFPGAVYVFGYRTMVVGPSVAPQSGPGGLGNSKLDVIPAMTWQLDAELTAFDARPMDYFGCDVAIFGNTLLVGAPGGGADAQGAAYVFTKPTLAWMFQQVLYAGDAAPVDFFGAFVALAADTALVGALYADAPLQPDAGAAYVFALTEGTWSQRQKLGGKGMNTEDYAGGPVALDGQTALVGATGKDVGTNQDQGKVLVYQRTDALYLLGGRFKVTVEWSTPSPSSGIGHPVPLTSESGCFWFFDSGNVELVVKCLDGTGVNEHYWVFYGSLTDCWYMITILDTSTGAVKKYQALQGVQSCGNDTQAF